MLPYTCTGLVVCFNELINVYFVYFLINDAVSLSDYVVSSGRMINELEMIWKEAVVVK
jgi:hypothetical protein